MGEVEGFLRVATGTEAGGHVPPLVFLGAVVWAGALLFRGLFR